MVLTNALREWPSIIQGGMGIGVSNYRLARAAAAAGCVGVVSGTGVDSVFVRRLQQGDPSGDVRRALANFPWPSVAERCLSEYFIPGGKRADAAFRLLPLPGASMSISRQEIIVLANFAEVWLAKEGAGHLIGINFLEKIQALTLPSIFGALLAGVDAILMGAGIPSAIPEAIRKLSNWESAELRLAVEGETGGAAHHLRFDPREMFGEPKFEVRRPKFLAIVSSHVLAKVLHKKTQGQVDGFVVEDHTAGGHNAPPRKVPNQPEHASKGFGPLDAPNFAEMSALGVPYWQAGSVAAPERLTLALEAGAQGVQIGSAFAFCDESAILPELKRDVIQHELTHRLRVVTDFEASPTGYPFKRLEREGSPGEIDAQRARERVCDLGYLRRAFVDEAGRLAWRCAGEPVATYLKKGGTEPETVNKLCLCNQLLATVGLGQARDTGDELALITAGEDLSFIRRLVPDGAHSYSARDVVHYMHGASAAESED